MSISCRIEDRNKLEACLSNVCHSSWLLATTSPAFEGRENFLLIFKKSIFCNFTLGVYSILGSAISQFDPASFCGGFQFPKSPSYVYTDSYLKILDFLLRVSITCCRKTCMCAREVKKEQLFNFR